MVINAIFFYCMIIPLGEYQLSFVDEHNRNAIFQKNELYLLRNTEGVNLCLIFFVVAEFNELIKLKKN